MTIPDTLLLDGNVVAKRSYAVGPQSSFVDTVDLSTGFTLRTLDASGNQIREGIGAGNIDPSSMFPVTGPVELAGVRAGDTIGLTVVDLRTATEAHCWTRPGIGIGPDFGYHVRRVDLGSPRWPGLPDIELTLQPHVGTLGVLPSLEHPARDLGTHGGNLDMSELGSGATLWLRAQRDGAGVFAGDIHAAIGDAEICGTGLEASGEIDLRAVVRRDWSPSVPVITRNGRAWLIGVATNVEDAIRTACDAAIAALSESLAIPEAEAYLLVGQLLEVRVCQIVNPHVSVSVSLKQGLDACFAPPALDEASNSTPEGREQS
jgi:amidase